MNYNIYNTLVELFVNAYNRNIHLSKNKMPYRLVFKNHLVGLVHVLTEKLHLRASTILKDKRTGIERGTNYPRYKVHPKRVPPFPVQ